ncbi:oocyte zinc finger protein XlCOF7.1-like isoform X1 [Bufo gargarizans]|uniref:oocyte zinc finger protein XlCOF7.1-like isoform X1 n=2 Tax=Bufo gargarizans TaxID=30331 RepID=UPI001CF5D656|nr:oocyte zinc finger protein XlCOF7.1-like isoform X1 [Bufo gargarizans]XP_044155805.1 oocyte zinc finger protein XlCOF7.1-like isoform X1 [Bufo gargarizans]XP_044155806.1 oocyte zinc finger protein XlCOF7.1-like isoform X1 [Bufo gargarizans]
MEKNKSAIKEKIINLTLEILYLLTGEDYIIVKKPGGHATHNRLQVVEGICRTLGNVLLTPPHSVTPQEDNEQKILELTNKIIELLTGEVSIRCQDVTVCFSMEEWEYIERHKDLYKDILMENRQNIILPDGPDCKNSLFCNVTPEYLNGDDMAMDTESETESLKIHSPLDVQTFSREATTGKISGYKNRNISHVEDLHYSSIHIKEEPCDVSWDGENLPNTTDPTVQFHSVHIKEEPVSDDEENSTDSNIYTQHAYLHSMEGPVSCGGQDLTLPNVYTSTDPSQYPYTHNIQESFSFDRGKLAEPDSYRPTDHMHQHSTIHIMEEPALSNSEDHYDTNFSTQYLPVQIKEEPVSGDDHIHIKTRRYPSRQSTSPIKQRGPASHKGIKRKNLKNTVKEPPVTSTDSGETDENEKNCSSVYSVRQSANTMEILYHCPSCHKGFYSNLDLARHQVIHTVDKFFICSLCGKSFTEMSFLVKHQVIHTDLKLCVCQVCGGCFYSETSLAKHQKSHSLPMYCSTCGRCFFSKTELEMHKRKHTGERPYSCHMCGKHFIAKSVLNKHMLTHTQSEQSK